MSVMLAVIELLQHFYGFGTFQSWYHRRQPTRHSIGVFRTFYNSQAVRLDRNGILRCVLRLRHIVRHRGKDRESFNSTP